jgi:hypothetical protein
VNIFTYKSCLFFNKIESGNLKSIIVYQINMSEYYSAVEGEPFYEGQIPIECEINKICDAIDWFFGKVIEPKLHCDTLIYKEHNKYATVCASHSKLCVRCCINDKPNGMSFRKSCADY